MSNSLKKLLKSVLDDDDKDEKVIKTWPMTKDEKKQHVEMLKMARDQMRALDRLKMERGRFWADVQDRLDEYGVHLRVNAKKGVIEKIEGGIEDDDASDENDE